MLRSILLSGACTIALLPVPCAAQDATVGPSQPVSYFNLNYDYDDVAFYYFLNSFDVRQPNCSYAVELIADENYLQVAGAPNEPRWWLAEDCDRVSLFLELFSNDPSALSRVRAQTATTTSPGAAAFGSQGLTLFALPKGELIVAWINNATLYTAPLLSSGATSQTIQPARQYALSGQSPSHVIAGDFNGDGIPDLAISNSGNLNTNAGGNIMVFLGKGDGTFTAGATVNAGVTPVAMSAADFNGDGKLDLAVANLTTGSISVLLGNGDGTFQAPVAYTVDNSPQSVVAADFNGDGNIDIAVASQGGTVSILLGNGNGTFKASVPYPGGSKSATYLAWMDLNGDGKLDLIVADQLSNALAILLGNGDGTFRAPAEYVTGANPQYFGATPGASGESVQMVTVDAVSGAFVITPVLSNGIAVAPPLYPVGAPAYGVATADMNGDGYPDMVVAAGSISVLLRNPAAAFNPPVNYTLHSGSQAVAVALGDLNGDGNNDVVAASTFTASNGVTFGGTVDVALNNGDGTLGTQYSYALGGYPGGPYGDPPGGVVIGDFNGDGKPDVAAGYQTAPADGVVGGGISVLLGKGDGTLLPAVNYGVGFSVVGVVAGDFTGNGKLDLVAAMETSSTAPGALAFFQGNGDGTFQNPVMIQVGSPTAVALAAADVNDDGNLDLVASVLDANSNASIVVLLGNGNGTFRQLAPIQTPVAGSPIALLDLNGDGVLDLVVGDSLEGVYLLGNGDGTFQTPQYFSSGSHLTGFAVADWNHDGIAGLAIASHLGTVMAMESGLNPKYFGFRSLTNTSAAAGVTALAPGSLATAFGTDLATATAGASSTPLPTNLKGTSVSIVDSAGITTAGPLAYVSPKQVNFLIPDTVATGIATITVTSGDGTRSAAATNIASVAPALFTSNASNLAAAVAVCTSASGTRTVENVYQVVNGSVVAAPINLKACSETVLELYATGMDSVSAGDVKVTFAGVAGSVLYAGRQGSFIGLDQINVAIPQSLAGSGNVPIVVLTGGMKSNTVNVTLQ